MARLHVDNLLTWRSDAFAQRAFDRAELDALERRLSAIADEQEAAPPVTVGLGELVLS
jgi:hypothetical protein